MTRKARSACHARLYLKAGRLKKPGKKTRVDAVGAVGVAVETGVDVAVTEAVAAEIGVDAAAAGIAAEIEDKVYTASSEFIGTRSFL